MKKTGFTLLELLAAVMLGALIMLMIAGGLTTAIRSWNSVQERVGVNYNRRSVLDLVKRQTSSLFFHRDVQQLEGANPGMGRVPNGPKRVIGNRNGNANPPNDGNTVRNQSVGFSLPDGSSYFEGGLQELNFTSTVSFLSDFPGPVAVRYYVVQGNPGDDESIVDLPNSRSVFIDDEIVDDADLDFSFDEGAMADALEGQLYLYLEEKNLYLANTNEDQMGINDPFAERDAANDARDEENARPPMEFTLDGDGFVGGQSEDISQVFATSTMRLIGPLRSFQIRYRRANFRQNVDDFDDEEAWASAWRDPQKGGGGYPTAVEFLFVFEPEGDPDKTAEIDTENLPRVRMVLPIYDQNNLNDNNVWGEDGGEELINGDR